MSKKVKKVVSWALLLVMLTVVVPKNIVLADGTEPTTFDEASAVHDENMGTYWSAVEAYYGPDEETPGLHGQYMNARENYADDVVELYEAALEGRAACVSAYENIVISYEATLAKYEQLDDSVKAEEGMLEWKAGFDEGYVDATNVYEDLSEVPPLVDDMESIYIDGDGNINGNPNAPAYWSVSEDGLLTMATEDNYTLKVEKTDEGVVLYMKNFSFTSTSDYITDAIWSESPLVINLEGTNSITAQTGNALGVIEGLKVQGAGSLELVSVSEEIVPENGDEPYTPMALYVGGLFENHAKITCDSKNSDCTVAIDCEAEDMVNTGTLTVGDNQKIGTWSGVCDELVKPISYSSSKDYPVPIDHKYVAKVYYYTPDVMYPNSVCGHNDDTDQWTVVGNYDESGKPIGSNIWYQYWYVDERGTILTEDLVNPVQFLVYEEKPESLIEEKDIVSVSDGEEHVFNADLYALWFTCGNVTVNGNIIQDLACANIAERVPAASEEYFDFVFDNDGNRVWLETSTKDSKVVVNGNVGLLSLNDSYCGDITVKGNVNLIGFYEDLAESVKTTLDPVPETFYGAKANAGDIVVDGEFVGISKKSLEGYRGYSVFNTEDFYAQTARAIKGEEVHGTSVAIKGDEMLIDVSKSVVGETTWPCVKEVDAKRETEVKAMLTDKDSKLIVMDICLIQDNVKKVEPTKTLNLYLDNITGFSKPAVYHIKANGEVEKIYVYDGNGQFDGSIMCATDSFSTYFIAEDQLLVQDVPETPDNTPNDDQTGVPPTGDARSVEVILCVVLMGICAMTTSALRKRIS